MFSKSVADPDLWGHVKFGQDLWHTGQIVRSDPYSYLTENQVWINHEWLAEAIFYLAFALGGPSGLVVLKAAISLLIIGLLYRHLFRQGLTLLQGGILLTLASPLLVPWLATVRPQAFTYLLFLLVLLLVHQIDGGRIRWLWATPPLFALWVNLHGGFLAGMGIFVLWSFSHLMFRLLRTRQPVFLLSPTNLAIYLAIIASMFATLLNPYGAQLLVFLLQTATVPRPEIVEWNPIAIMTLSGAMFIILLVLASVGIVYSRRERRPALIVLFLGAALLPLIAFRHTPLFVLVTLALAGEHIGDVWNRWSGPQLLKEGFTVFSRVRPWLVGLHFIGAIVLVGLSFPNFGCIPITRPISFPARSIALLKESGLSGNLAVHFGWGEYAIWHLAPWFKVSVDGRRETVYSDRIYRENTKFTWGRDDWDALLQNHETHLALVSKKFPVFNLMKLMPSWPLVYEDPLSGLFVRQGSPHLERIQGIDQPAIPYNGAGSCFP